MSEIQNIVDKIIAEKGKDSDKVIPILQTIQGKFNYLPEEALKEFAIVLKLRNLRLRESQPFTLSLDIIQLESTL